MKQSLLIINLFFLLAVTKVSAQVNLVPNGDFESYSALPTYPGQCYLAIGWDNVNVSLTITSPDYSNVLSYMYWGALTPYSGNGQMGMAANSLYREYISTQLASPMIPGNRYLVSLYLSNGNDTTAASTSSCNNFGAFFSDYHLYQNQCYPIILTPQIEIDSIIYAWNIWQHFSFTYTADDSSKYVTFGNFRTDSNTLLSTFGNGYVYYFIDKI